MSDALYVPPKSKQPFHPAPTSVTTNLDSAPARINETHTAQTIYIMHVA